MATIKKKDLKKYRPKTYEQEIEELVDTDGSAIGDKKGSDRNPTNDTEIEVPDQQTSDEFATQAIQPNRYYYGIGGTAYSHGARVQSEGELSESELAEAKMKDMIENLMGNRTDNRDMVKKYRDSDVNRNEIPDMEELATTYQKPIVVKKTQEILKTMEMNKLSGEEVGIVINYILNNVDLNQIPQDYKRLLRKNL
jgi:hypothetical protein